MKKIVVAVVAMLAIGTSSFAQGFGLGVKAGLNVSGMNNTGLDSKTGLTAGVFVDYRFNDWIGMSADLLFSREGAMLKSVKQIAPRPTITRAGTKNFSL